MNHSSCTPSPWLLVRMRFLLDKNRSSEEENSLINIDKVNFIPMEAVGEEGGLDLSIIRPKEEVENGYTLFFDNDVVIAKITPCFENRKGALIKGLLGGVGFGTTELYVLNPADCLLPKFLFYVTISDSFRIPGEAAMKGAAGQKRVPTDFIQDFKVHLLSIEVQKAVVEYLDYETAEIDALVGEKERMLALLEEKREALISHVVTRGLDPNIPLKPSNVDWLGDIPQHWQILRAKGLFHEIDDRTTTGEEELLSLRMHIGLVPHHDVSEKKLEPKDVIGFKRVQTGQLVINRMRASMGLIAVAKQPGLVSPDYAVFDIVRPIHVPYFLALFNTPLVGALFRSVSRGIGTGSQGFLRLYTENFLALHFPVPPLEEQQEIMNCLHKERRRTSELEEALTISIALLKERRAALITAAVTGQIDMENMAA